MLIGGSVTPRKAPKPRPLATVVLDRMAVGPNTGEILRYLGYPAGRAPAPRVIPAVERAIATSRTYLRPRATYSLYEVAWQDKRSLTLAGDATFRGAIGDYLSAARRAAVFVATAGEEIVELTQQALRLEDLLGGLVFGAIGSHVAEEAAEAVVEHLRLRTDRDESLTLRYSPGYCGMNLAQQQLIFDLVNAESVGVELLPSLIMKPVKSVSGIVGVGAKEAILAYGSPCDRCPLLDCRMRR